MEKIKNLIDGKLIEPVDGGYLDNYDPSTGQAYSQVPASNQKDVDLAVQAATKAFPIWSQMPAYERAQAMRKLIQLVRENQEELSQIESKDVGKTITQAGQAEIPRAVMSMDFFTDSISQKVDDAFFSDNNALNISQRIPLGVVGTITPWNLPFYLLTWKIAPAIAMGNCVVAKPSEVTPQSAFKFSELCVKAGLPAGVVNIVHGSGPDVGEAMINNPGIKAISFTGSTKTGTAIASKTGPLLKKTSLEMGGKNPNIVFEDCDFEKAVEGTIKAAFTNQGQVCLCGSRILIQKSIYDSFKEALVEKTKQLVVGDPSDTRTNVGAMVSKPHFEKVMGYLDLAISEGGKVLTGGKALSPQGRCADGWFIEPTLIEGLGNSCRTNQEEIFGPIATLIPFDTEEEAITLANDTSYGLASSLWTQDINRAHRVSSQILSGVVWVNCWMVRDLRTPFGGMKSSGMGREGGQEVLRFFSEPRNVCIKL